MQTRTALQKLSKGDKVYDDRVGGGLFKDSKRFLDMYDDRERQIIASKNADSVPMPFLDSIKRKVSKLVDTPDTRLPLVTRFDLYTGIRKMSERAPADQGLKKLAAHLERAWHADPLGMLSVGDTTGLVAVYRDQFPRSKAADAIEAYCTKAGVHKLPVAKLARIASNIYSQADYDVAIEQNGYDSNRLEHVRARSLIRHLVAMRGDAESIVSNEYDTTEVVDGRVASSIVRRAELDKCAGYEEALQSMATASDMASKMVELLNHASVDFFQDGIDSAGQLSSELADALDEWHGALTDARDQAAPLSESQVDTQVEQANQPGIVDTLRQKFVPQRPEQQPTDPQLEQDMADAGMKRKWYNPATWFSKAHKAALDKLIRTASNASVYANDEYSTVLASFIRDLRTMDRRMAQLAPQLNQDQADMPFDDMVTTEPALGEPALDGPAPSMNVEPSDVEMGTNIMHEIEDVAHDVIEEAPPDAMDYIQHEMAEGHQSPPGTAQWGAEEILNEGHQSPPPSDGWLDEELSELEHGTPMKPVAAKGKGIPLPDGEIKQQPNADSSDVDVCDNGGTTLKASQIEESLLNGNVVRDKTGSVRIFINDSDEVELWDKTAGRACDLMYLDTAISDFINLVNNERIPKKISKTVDVVYVPCENCAQLTLFKHASNDSDQYLCTCGHLINAGVVNSLIKLGQLQIRKVAQEFFSMNDKQHAQLAEKILDSVSDMNDWNGEILQAVLKVSGEDPRVDPDSLLNWCKIMAPKIQQMVNMQQRITPSEDDMAQPGLELNDWREQKRAQMVAPPAPMAPAPTTQAPAPSVPTSAMPPPAPVGDDEQPVTDMPLDEVIKGAFVNYKAQGMALPDALRTFFKEHADLVEQRWSPDADAALVAMQTQYFTANPMGGAPAGAPAQSSMPTPMPMSAQKVMEPSIRKPKDKVPVGDKPLGKDSDGKDLLPSTSVKQQQGKPDGKLSDTNLGADSDSKDIQLAKPKKTTPTKGKLPNTDLGKDSEPNEGFKAPKVK